MSNRLARLVLHRPKSVLIAVLILVLAASSVSTSVFKRLASGGFTDPGTESAQAAAVLQRTFHQGDPNLELLVTAPGGVDGAAATRAGLDLTRRLAAEPGVADVVSYWSAGRPAQLRSRNGDQALVLATVTGDDNAVEHRMPTLDERYQGGFEGLRLQIGGPAEETHEINVQTTKDATKGEEFVFPVTLVVLIIIFGSVVAALLPLVVALATMLLALLLMWLLSQVTDVSTFVLNIVTFLGLGLAIDYSLLIVSRYREELRRGQEMAEAIRITLRTSGRTVLFSAITVAVALSAMAVFPFYALSSLAYAGVATALLAAGVAVTLVPALLVVLGPRINKWQFLRRGSLVSDDPRRTTENGFWHRLAMFVMRHPARVAVLLIVFLLFLGSPFLGIKLRLSDASQLPASSEAYQVAQVVNTQFTTQEDATIQVVAEHTGTSGGPAAVAGYAARLSGLPDVGSVDAATGSYAHGVRVAPPGPDSAQFTAPGAAYLAVVPTVDWASPAADNLVGEIRAMPAPFPVLVGGAPAVSRDTFQSLYRTLPIAGGIIAVSTLVLLFLLTGSVVLPVLAIILSVLSMTATFGALVWIFQDGHLTWLVPGHFNATDSINWSVPPVLFALAFGLSMDYQVFLLARIKEEYRQIGNNTMAVARGLEKIGRLVTAAALLISIVFVAFTFSGVSFMKSFGIGLPLAVLMDATLIRGALLPAFMRMAGRWTWWAPPPLRRLHRRIGLDEAPAAPGGRVRTRVRS